MEHRQQKSIRSYVPTEVLKHIKVCVEKAETSGQPLRRQLKTPAVTSHFAVTLFADVSGFTKVTERLSDLGNTGGSLYGTDLLAFNLNRYMSALVTELTRSNADIIKFAGDSIVAIYPIDGLETPTETTRKRSDPKGNANLGGVGSALFRKTKKKRKNTGQKSNIDVTNPLIQEECNRVVGTALIMQDDIKTSALRITANDFRGVDRPDGVHEVENEKLLLQVKFGVGLGEVTIGHIGGASDRVMSRRVEYVALGNALNQAFDAEGFCQGGDVCVSGFVFTCLKTRFKENKEAFPYHKPEVFKDKKGNPYYKLVPRQRPKFTLRDKILEDFSSIPTQVLWSYVPLTAKPYSQVESVNEKWVSEIRKVTTIFAQLGFPADLIAGVGEKDPRSLETFNNVFKEVQNCVFRYEGQINKFLVDDKGNTLLAVFGLNPFAHDNDEARAVLCGEAIIKVLKSHGFWRSVGVSTGMVYCGLFGSEVGKRREYTVLGDSVNIAARLMVQVQLDGLPTGKEIKLEEAVVSASNTTRKNNNRGPMYIDLPTRIGLTRHSVKVQFTERDGMVKVKGKSTNLRIFHINNFYSNFISAALGGGSNKVVCVLDGDNAGRNSIRDMSTTWQIVDRSITFKEMAKKFNKRPEQIVWHRSLNLEAADGAKILQNVNEQDVLSQLLVESDSRQMLFFEEHALVEQKATIPRLKNQDYQFQFEPLKKPLAWPERIMHVKEEGKHILRRERCVKSMSNISESTLTDLHGSWYECEDTFNIVSKLQEAENTAADGLQIIGLEGGYGVGKSFSVNLAFNKNAYNLNHNNMKVGEDDTPVIINVEANPFTTKEEEVFSEISEIIKLLLVQYNPSVEVINSKDEQRRARNECILQAFQLGRDLLYANAGDEAGDFNPEEDKLFLFNDFLETSFAIDEIGIVTMEEDDDENSENTKKKLIASRKDMMKLFMYDKALSQLASETDPHALMAFDQRFDNLSVRYIAHNLCAVLAGFTVMLKKPIISIIENGEYIGPFSWLVLLILCKGWRFVPLTFVIPQRVISTIENLGSDSFAIGGDQELPVGVEGLQFPIEAAEMTDKLIGAMKEGYAMPDQQVLDNNLSKLKRKDGSTKVLKRRQSAYRKQLFSANVTNMLKDKEGDDRLPYPFADKEFDIHCLQLRLREFENVRFIEIRPRKEYTSQIASNILENDNIPEDCISVLERFCGGNPTFIRETLSSMQNNKLLRKLSQTLAHQGTKVYYHFDEGQFHKKVLEVVPSLVESLCSMIFDQLSFYAQVMLKAAAYAASRKGANDCVTLKLIEQAFPFSNKGFLQEEWEYLINSLIVTPCSKDDKLDDSEETKYRFAAEWMRYSMMRKLTNEQKRQLYTSLKV